MSSIILHYGCEDHESEAHLMLLLVLFGFSNNGPTKPLPERQDAVKRSDFCWWGWKLI